MQSTYAAELMCNSVGRNPALTAAVLVHPAIILELLGGTRSLLAVPAGTHMVSPR